MSAANGCKNVPVNLACPHCNCFQKDRLHMATHVMSCTATPKKVAKPAKPSSHVCQSCKYALLTKEYLANHIKLLHPEAKANQCSACGAMYYSSEKMNAHLQTCSARHKCHHCWQDFFSERDLVDHHYICIYKKTCLACQKEYPSGQLKSHIQSMHCWGTIPCFKCGFLCANKAALKLHVFKCVERPLPPASSTVRPQQALRQVEKKCLNPPCVSQSVASAAEADKTLNIWDCASCSYVIERQRWYVSCIYMCFSIFLIWHKDIDDIWFVYVHCIIFLIWYKDINDIWPAYMCPLLFLILSWVCKMSEFFFFNFKIFYCFFNIFT